MERPRAGADSAAVERVEATPRHCRRSSASGAGVNVGATVELLKVLLGSERGQRRRRYFIATVDDLEAIAPVTRPDVPAPVGWRQLFTNSDRTRTGLAPTVDRQGRDLNERQAEASPA
jgi:hypothetical protein